MPAFIPVTNFPEAQIVFYTIYNSIMFFICLTMTRGTSNSIFSGKGSYLSDISHSSYIVEADFVAGGSAPATLPLPLAAFVSLTITYKLDSVSERFLNLAGPALENLAAGCPWPSMPIVASLWVQKVKRWNDYLTFSASRTVFQQNRDAVVQLLKSCFTATLGLSICSSGGVGALLGHGFGSHFPVGSLQSLLGFYTYGSTGLSEILSL